MLMHADYFSIMHSTVRVFTNRIVFQNAGRFGIDIKEPAKVAISKPRNPVIARFFRWAKLAENAGFGFDKMLKWKYKVDFQSHIDFSETTFSLEDGSISEQDKNNTEKVTEKVTENQKKIIDCISKNQAITSNELAKKIGITPEKIRANISKLKSKGIIHREGADKGGKWVIIKTE